MPALYVDTRALVKRYGGEVGTLPAPLLVSTDDTLLAAAKAEGCVVDTPRHHPSALREAGRARSPWCSACPPLPLRRRPPSAVPCGARERPQGLSGDRIALRGRPAPLPQSHVLCCGGLCPSPGHARSSAEAQQSGRSSFTLNTTKT